MNIKITWIQRNWRWRIAVVECSGRIWWYSVWHWCFCPHTSRGWVVSFMRDYLRSVIFLSPKCLWNAVECGVSNSQQNWHLSLQPDSSWPKLDTEIELKSQEGGCKYRREWNYWKPNKVLLWQHTQPLEDKHLWYTERSIRGCS